MKFWGFKEVHGRIWTLIYLSEDALSSPLIMKSLGLSKSAANMALADLRQYDLIEFAGIDDTRHQRYRTELSFEDVLTRMFTKQYASFADELSDSIKAVEKVAARPSSRVNRRRARQLLQATALLPGLKRIRK